ncbi:MAG TPA: helix-turn-helix transcriptional regulator [Isosphaeraceae bacterium]|jgi:DNA-binding XRE family transcriptional regulator
MKRVHRKIERTPEEQARLRTARDRFQAERPGLEELVASGEYEGPMPLGVYMGLAETLARLRLAREREGLSLADVSERSGIDRAAISRLENGLNPNPTIDTLGRYAAALGKQIAFAVVDEAPR